MVKNIPMSVSHYSEIETGYAKNGKEARYNKIFWVSQWLIQNWWTCKDDREYF